MNSDDLQGYADLALRSALAAGASAADVIIQTESSLLAAVRLGKAEKLKHSRRRRVGVRAFVGRRCAVSSSADFAREAIRDLAADTVAHARLAQPDPHAGLPNASLLASDLPDLELYDQEAEGFSPAEAVRLATAAEEAALAADQRITNSEGAEFEVSAARIVYASSEGFAGSYPSSRFTLSVVPVAGEGREMQRDWWYSTSRHLKRLDVPEAVGREAALRALRRLGARPVKTQEVPVVFEAEVAASLLSHVAAAVSGTSLHRRASFMLGRLGRQVAPSGVTLLDDGCRSRGLASRPFDAEGLATRKTAVIEAGKLNAYLLDTYSARKLGREPTGSAFRSAGTPPAPGSSNFYMVPGRSSPREIVRSVRQGLLVTELIGMGVNIVTGDYSRGAAGQWIEGGETVYPVEQVTIAGNLLDMLGCIEAVANDLSFRHATCAPTIKIARMAVAGI